MNKTDDTIKRRERDLENYFHYIERDRLLKKGYKLPTIGDYNMAGAVFTRTYNKLEKEFCKTVMYAYIHQQPLHSGMLKNLRRLADKHTVKRIKLV